MTKANEIAMAKRRRDFRSFCGATERIRNVQQRPQTQRPLLFCFVFFFSVLLERGGFARASHRCGCLVLRCHNADAAAAAAARRDVATRRLQSTGDAEESGENWPGERVSR